MGDSFLDLLMAQQEGEPEQEAAGEGDGGIWVVAELREGHVVPATLEMMNAARGLSGALGAYVHGVLMGEGMASGAPLLFQAGADLVHVADHPALAGHAVEPRLEVLAGLVAARQPEVVMLAATRESGQLAARLAQRSGGGLIERAVAVEPDDTRTVQAAVPLYGGDYYDLVACPGARPLVITVEPGAFAQPYLDPGRGGEAELLDVEPAAGRVRWVGEAEGFVPPPVPLSRARVIVAAGRQAVDFRLVERLAEALGGCVAGDRGARDAGWIGPEQVVDVRGVTVSPEVYVAVGVPGDTFHNAAVEGARFIAAIHPDPEAAIFRIADLCLEADPLEVLPALIEGLS